MKEFWHKLQLWRYHLETDLEYGFGRSEEIRQSNDDYSKEQAILRGFK